MTTDLRNVLEAIQAGVVILDPSGHVEAINSAASRILELGDQAARGRGLEALLGPDHPVERLAAGVLESGASAQASDVRIERRMHDDLLVDVAASPLFDDAGEEAGLVIVLRDRTLQKRLQQLETERERNASFGRIAAGLAHEIKNPLGGIRGAAELLARRSQDEKERSIADLIVSEVTRIAALVDDFMVFARGDELRMEPTNVHEVLDGVLTLLGLDPLAAKVEVVREYDPSLPELVADADRLTQVFLNLARNAVQAMAPGGGRLTVSTRMTLDHRITTPEGLRVPTLVVGFDDEGPGMDEETLRQAPIPFFTTRQGGTGLGLAVAQYWLGRHGGDLHLESEPGEGTRARVALPLRRADRESCGAAEEGA